MGSLGEVTPDMALLLEGDLASPTGFPSARFEVGSAFGHAVGCACCRPRGAAAEALSRLYLARVRGTATPFAEVLVVTASAAGRRAVVDAIANDPLTRARFCLASR
ncbi:MAG: hypothetical protein WBQ75_06230 [Acetobacteraceae bacterium]